MTKLTLIKAIMAATILSSPRAVAMSIEVVRAFVRLRHAIASHADLERRIDELESRYDARFADVFEAIRSLLEPPEDEVPQRKRIGFRDPDAPESRAIPGRAEAVESRPNSN